MKTNLPVVLLKGILLLPDNEIRIEVENNTSTNIIDLAELFHDNKLLIVSQTNPLEEQPQVNELPKIGVIAKIKHKMELPNGYTRILLKGLDRAEVIEYINQEDGSIESFVKAIDRNKIAQNESQVLTRKLYKELENYISKVPYVSNSILGKIEEIKELSKITDLIAPQLPLNFERQLEYLTELSSLKRTEMILEDIYREIEVYNIEKLLDNRVRHDLETTQKEFILREKMKFIKEALGESSNKDDEVEKMREKAKELDLPRVIAEKLETEIQRFELLSQTSPEINITKSYIDWILELPWNHFTKDSDNIKEIRNILDESHSGLDDVKQRIIEYIAVSKMTEKLAGPILCLVGPPGVGKTSITKSIAKALDKNFVKMSVGGLHDENEIRGHRRTYLGANPGRIIQSMKKAKSSNPLFLIDEIDKMTKDIKGDPASALLDILDPEQNKYFSDNFIEEDYDLSNVMFIATANYLDQIPEALRDRLEIVELTGYTELEKLDIAAKHLLPNILKQHGLKQNNVEVSDEVLLEIIRNYTKEAGVRELNRQIEKIIRKIVTQIVSTNIKISKLIIDKNALEKYLGKPKYLKTNEKVSEIGVANGLAYTSCGGDILPIEVNYFKGNGNLKVTGQIGDVMKESAEIALSYLKANSRRFNLDFERLTKSDIHIHVPEGAIKKDGPSAGITLTTALISAFKREKINSDIAMTGEITLRGKVLPIGGLKEKTVAALRAGITKIFIPYENLNSLEKLPKEVIDAIEFVPVKDYKEIYNQLFRKENLNDRRD